MAVDTTTAAPAPPILQGLEGVAWRIPLPSRRLFLALAVLVVVAIGAGSLAAAWVAARNASTIASARDTGLQVAGAATELRTHLAAADAQAASTLLSGGLEAPEARDAYLADLDAASQALTDAALVATDDDRGDIAALASGLSRYAGLVETARANARQGFPIGAAYLDQARSLARDELAPTADHLRRAGEQRVARAANSVGGPVGALAVVVLLLALATVVGTAAVVAGRTRRLVHPAGLVAAVAAIVALVLVTAGIVAQSRELRAAATTDIESYIAANDAAFTVSALRVTEISAVASHGSGGPLYDEFDTAAAGLLDDLAGDPALGGVVEAVDRYREAVATVRDTDLEQGDNRAAADLTLGDLEAGDPRRDGSSAARFEAADTAATNGVDRAFDTLADRFDAADAAGVSPLVPLALGAVAAALAATGILARGRRYR